MRNLSKDIVVYLPTEDNNIKVLAEKLQVMYPKFEILTTCENRTKNPCILISNSFDMIYQVQIETAAYIVQTERIEPEDVSKYFNIITTKLDKIINFLTDSGQVKCRCSSLDFFRHGCRCK